jgi:hypothetical protein
MCLVAQSVTQSGGVRWPPHYWFSTEAIGDLTQRYAVARMDVYFEVVSKNTSGSKRFNGT